jgi:hypothetical protein
MSKPSDHLGPVCTAVGFHLRDFMQGRADATDLWLLIVQAVPQLVPHHLNALGTLLECGGTASPELVDSIGRDIAWEAFTTAATIVSHPAGGSFRIDTPARPGNVSPSPN